MPVTETVLPQAEHISLESEQDASPGRRPAANKIRSTYTLESPMRGCSTQMSILEDHFLSVRAQRPDADPIDYVFDLRFVNPQPVIVRHVPWIWLAGALAWMVIAFCAGLLAWFPILESIPSGRALVTAGATIVSGLALWFSLRRMTETLQFESVHGGAPFVHALGGIGAAKGGRKFFVDVIRNITAAQAAREQTNKQQALREEMREHHRLRELGVLSEEEYESSKKRILAAFS